MKKVRRFTATVSSYLNGQNEVHEWPVYAWTHEMAKDMAFAYVLQVLKIRGDFELRITGT